MNLTEAHKAAAFEWLRYLAERHGNIDGLDRKQAEIALRAWHDESDRADELDRLFNAAIQSKRDAEEAQIGADEEAERLRGLRDQLQQQAEIHAQEARTANATIHEIYQLCTGATGEPGNWHGAEPVRHLLEQLAQLREELAERSRKRAHVNDSLKLT